MEETLGLYYSRNFYPLYTMSESSIYALRSVEQLGGAVVGQLTDLFDEDAHKQRRRVA